MLMLSKNVQRQISNIRKGNVYKTPHFLFFLKRRVSLNAFKLSEYITDAINTEYIFTPLQKQKRHKVAPKVYPSTSGIDFSSYPHRYVALV